MSLATRPGLLTTLPRGVLVNTGKAFLKKIKNKQTKTKAKQQQKTRLR